MCVLHFVTLALRPEHSMCVLQAMSKVDRANYVLDKVHAYEDSPQSGSLARPLVRRPHINRLMSIWRLTPFEGLIETDISSRNRRLRDAAACVGERRHQTYVVGS